MEQKQIEFLEQFMDDYQINKFHYLVGNGIIQGVEDLYDIKEDYRNIEFVMKENDLVVRLMNAFEDINQRQLIRNIESQLNEKKGLVNQLDNFVEENISSLKEEYKERMKNVHNSFVNNGVVDIKNRVIEKENKIEKLINLQNKLLLAGYVVLIALSLYKVFS